MSQTGQRPAVVNLVLLLLVATGLYGLLMARDLWPLVSSPLFQAGLPAGFTTVAFIAVGAIGLASLGNLWAVWQAFSQGGPSARKVALTSISIWTGAMVLLALSPYLLDAAGASLTETIEGFMTSALKSLALVRAGVPALLGAFAVYQLRSQPDVLYWFGADEVGVGVIHEREVVHVKEIEYRTPPPEAATLAPSSAVPIAELVRVRRGQPIGKYEVTATPTRTKLIIGRDRRQSQIPLEDDPTVSRTHAALLVDSGRVYIEDLASQWGVEINGRKIIQRTLLFHNDRIRLGDSEFIFSQAQQ